MSWCTVWSPNTTFQLMTHVESQGLRVQSCSWLCLIAEKGYGARPEKGKGAGPKGNQVQAPCGKEGSKTSRSQGRSLLPGSLAGAGAELRTADGSRFQLGAWCRRRGHVSSGFQATQCFPSAVAPAGCRAVVQVQVKRKASFPVSLKSPDGPTQK